MFFTCQFCRYHCRRRTWAPWGRSSSHVSGCRRICTVWGTFRCSGSVLVISSFWLREVFLKVIQKWCGEGWGVLFVQIVQQIPGACLLNFGEVTSTIKSEEHYKVDLSFWASHTSLFQVCDLFNCLLCVTSGFSSARCYPRPVHGGWRSCTGSN